MNCKIVQSRLLSFEDAAQIPAAIHAHLAFCQSCREWQSGLQILEQNVGLLPVPASRGKARFLGQFLIPDKAESKSSPERVKAAPKARAPVPLLLRTFRPISRTAAVVAAASLLTFAGWVLYNRVSTPVPVLEQVKPVADPLLASLVQRDIRLASANTPSERIEILSDMAQELQDATLTLAEASASEQLAGLAKLYDELVREGIIKQAQTLPVRERRPVLNPIAERLARTASVFERLVNAAPANCVKYLHTIADAARVGNRRLFGLVSEGQS